MNGEQPRPVFTGVSVMTHGLDAAELRLHHDEANDAWFLFLDGHGDMSIRIDLKLSTATLRRDQDGLRELAALAAQLAAEIAQRLAGRGQADDNEETS